MLEVSSIIKNAGETCSVKNRISRNLSTSQAWNILRRSQELKLEFQELYMQQQSKIRKQIEICYKNRYE